MLRPDNPEVVVERRHAPNVETLSDGNKACIGATERTVGVALNEHADTLPIVRRDRLDTQVAIDYGDVERRLGLSTELPAHEVGSLSDNHGSRHQRTEVLPDEGDAFDVEPVLPIGGRDQDSGVDDEHDRSVAPEALGQNLLDAVGGSGLRSADRDERRSSAGPAPRTRELRRQFGDEAFDTQAASIRLRP